jgi:hypothetical protein
LTNSLLSFFFSLKTKKKSKAEGKEKKNAFGVIWGSGKPKFKSKKFLFLLSQKRPRKE